MVVKSLMILVMSIVMFGCASTSDIENLQSQIDSVSGRVDAANLSANDAKMAAQDAQVKASRAEQAANRAAQYSADVNEKLDRLFKKQQHK
jgi:murein lipoprotein